FSQSACSARLRHSPAAAVLGVAGFVADSLDRFPSAVPAGSAAALARLPPQRAKTGPVGDPGVPLADVAAPARLLDVLLVERGDRGFLQPLDEAGVLHNSRHSGDGIAGRRMAPTGAHIGC